MRGRIKKALSGFYYVDTGEGIVTCRARGRFRKEGVSPLVGDRVEITGKSGDWYAIRFGETETGYVSGQYLTFEDPSTATTEK